MSLSAGVGYSDNPHSLAAATEATKTALDKLGGLTPNLCIVYTTSKHDPEEVKSGIEEVIGVDVPIVGGFAVGIITNDKLSYGGSELGIALFSGDDVKFDVFAQPGLGTGEEQSVGRKLAEQIAAKKFGDDAGMIIMYDSVRGDSGNLLNMATPLLQGMNEVFNNKWMPTVGVGMLGDMQFQPTKQWFGGGIVDQTAMALVSSGNIKMHNIIMHGCKPAGGYHKITKTDGAVILEIENQPALDFIAGLIGSDYWEEYPLFITLGLNKGDKFEDFREDNYANRLCMAIDKDRKGLVMFEPDLKAGDEVQLMTRDVDFNYIRARTAELLATLGDRKPVLAHYIDCAGRASAYCGSESEEAAEVQASLKDVPLLGMYSGVEIAKVGNEMQALDWTGVLTVFSAPK